MLRVEFHCHTLYSKDSLTRLEDLVRTCREKSIDRVIITDHNTIRGALEARNLDPQRVIVGEEIMTRSGELLAAFVEEEIPPGLAPGEAIARLREQGAFISVSHPFDPWRSGHWMESELLRILPKVDAIETYNARCMLPWFNWKAQTFARKHQVAGTAGSDAHAAFELGKATMLLPDFQDADGLRRVISQGRPLTRLSMPWVHLASRYAAWRKKQPGSSG